MQVSTVSLQQALDMWSFVATVMGLCQRQDNPTAL
jgi:hypothetical protein